jgi:hypothetical protein
MKDQKKNYQEPALNIIKMRSRGCILKDSYDATEPGGARQNDMLDN